MQTKSLVQRFFMVLAMITMLVFCLGTGSPAAHAQSLSAQQSTIPSVSSETAFIAPQVSVTCGGSIGVATDANGAPINWTFNTQSPGQVCVTVKYAIPILFAGQAACDLSFYVPAGDATGDILFHMSNGSIIKVNENPVSGFVEFGSQAGGSQVFFTDVNDQPTNSVRLGWGRTASFGIKAVCF